MTLDTSLFFLKPNNVNISNHATGLSKMPVSWMVSPPNPSGVGTSCSYRNMQTDNSTYTITIYSSRLFFPLWFAVHTHIVIECDGKSNRYEIFGRVPDSRDKAVEGYLYK